MILQIHVRSTDYNRTLMSAFSLLAGLLRDSCNQDQIFAQQFVKNWYPFPVHTVLVREDSLVIFLKIFKFYLNNIEKFFSFFSWATTHRALKPTGYFEKRFKNQPIMLTLRMLIEYELFHLLYFYINFWVIVISFVDIFPVRIRQNCAVYKLQ